MIKPLWIRLLEPEEYKETLHKLVDRYRKDHRVLSKSPVYEGLSLRQMIIFEKEICEVLPSQIVMESFEFSPLKLIELKQESKVRKIYIAAWPDKILLMTMARLLTEYLSPLFHDHLYSFRKGWGPLKAQNALSEFIKKNPDCYIIKRDITKYGDTIDQTQLIKKLSMNGVDEKFLKLLLMAISPMIMRGDQSQLERLIVGIPSGSPLVPIIENYYLLEMDQKLLGIKDSFFARYGDDFIYATQSLEVAQGAELIIDETVAKLGLTISTKKKVNLHLSKRTESINESYPPQRHFDWLGVSFHTSGEISFKETHRDEFRMFFTKELSALFTRSLDWNLNDEEKEKLLEKACREIISLKTNPRLLKIIVHKTDARLIKELDHYVKLLLVRLLKRKWNLSGKMAWLQLRKMKLPSLNYQRRQYLKRVKK